MQILQMERLWGVEVIISVLYYLDLYTHLSLNNAQSQL